MNISNRGFLISSCLLGIALAMNGCSSQERENVQASVRFIDPSPRGYSQSVEYSSGDSKMVFISGQVAVNEKGEIVGINDLEKQTDQVFKNIKAQVEKAGGTMDDIVRIGCYFTDLSKIAEFRKARDRYINLENPPASIAVEVKRLVNEDFLIEVDAVAVITK